MIHSMVAPSESTACLDHWPKLEAPREFNFTKGLNVLVGPNGSGKTTVLRMLASLVGAEKTVGKTTRTARIWIELAIRVAKSPMNFDSVIERWYQSKENSPIADHYADHDLFEVVEGDNNATLIIDEPDSGLDAETIYKIWRAIDMLSYSKMCRSF